MGMGRVRSLGNEPNEDSCSWGRRTGGRAGAGGGEPGASVRECTHKKFVANFVDTKGLRILASLGQCCNLTTVAPGTY